MICLSQVLCAQAPPGRTIPRDWHLLDPPTDSIVGISLQQAYDLLQGRAGETVVVAVIDNGFDIHHEDLKNNIWTNVDELANNGIDDDHNGYIDDVHGWNFVVGTADSTLDVSVSHGTHVAGIIAAQRNNGIGMNGIAGNVLVMPLVATPPVGDERDEDVANAIRYAVDNGARVINMSFSKLVSPGKDLVDAAIRYAEKNDVLLIHAAGNDGADIDLPVNYHYPIAILGDNTRVRNFITVGWSRELFNYRLAHPRSDYGKINVDLFAPGSDIYSTIPGNEYGSKSGSSMSAPIVTGVAALLFSYFPHLKATEVKDILVRSSFKTNQLVNKPSTQEKVPFSSLSVSGGVVNAYKAIQLALKEQNR